MDVRHTALALVTVAALGACGGQPQAAQTTVPAAHPTESNPVGDIPDDTVFLPFRPQGQGYEVKVPEGWARSDLPTGATFTDKLNSVRVELGAPSDPPGRPIDQKTVNRTGGQARLTVYRVDSAPDPVTGKVVLDEVERYVFDKGGRQAILTLSGPVGADNVDPWRTVSDSFRWTS
ncbi:hypothetical protein [Acrocarpospora catenulata]|uniref:hypothetical protein n=1 Tax=Acrocarpospora catenulata TaxID=2836182 RepID=UPI001BD95FE4|nr:hypothetical protein [Acrocarpospora catenulata]